MLGNFFIDIVKKLNMVSIIETLLSISFPLSKMRFNAGQWTILFKLTFLLILNVQFSKNVP